MMQRGALSMSPIEPIVGDRETTLMAAETAQAPDVVEAQLSAHAETCKSLAERLRARPPRLVMTCARGSSDHAATYAKYLIEIYTGTPVASAAPAIASVYQASLELEGALYLTVSQSGKSPDILASAQRARASGALVVALVNDASSPLAEAADICMPLMAGAERSVAATKSFIASLSAIAHIAAAWSGDRGLAAGLRRLPDDLRAACGMNWNAAVPDLVGAEDLLVVGRGVGLTLAQEAALKFKETASLHAEAFSAAELRHGPLAIMRPGLPVLAFAQRDETFDSVRQLAADLAEKGARLIVAGAELDKAVCLPVVEGLHPHLAPVAMAQSFYRLANEVSLGRGIDPDRPRYLSKVTETR